MTMYSVSGEFRKAFELDVPMHSACLKSHQWLHRTLKCWSTTSFRPVSTTSAIKRGLRATKTAPGARGEGRNRHPSASKYSRSPEDGTSKKTRTGLLSPIRDSNPLPGYESSERESYNGNPSIRRSSRPLENGSFRLGSTDRPTLSRNTSRKSQNTRSRPENMEQKSRRYPSSQDSRGGFPPNDDNIPVAVPYTTSASVFLYGLHTVYSALKAGRRKLYKLHIWSKVGDNDAQLKEIQRLARLSNVPITKHKFTNILNKMSEDRPHNGFVLEASRLPAPPVVSLGPWTAKDATIKLALEQQSTDDEAINGTSTSIPTSTKLENQRLARQPFVVLLDGITDPGNVGSILRTCYFYGVDAVAIATNTCANLNSATLAKASCGACEAIPVLALPRPSTFAHHSAKAGWRLFAAVAPNASAYMPERGAPDGQKNRHHTTESLAELKPLMTDPCILMLGAEDNGLRDNLRNKAADSISIESGRSASDTIDMGIDSVNVSVAAGALLESFLRPRGMAKKTAEHGDLGF